jgi:hypothetical protein
MQRYRKREEVTNLIRQTIIEHGEINLSELTRKCNVSHKQLRSHLKIIGVIEKQAEAEYKGSYPIMVSINNNGL